MAITISVRPLTGAQDITFHELELRHDCGSGPMTKHRNAITNHYTLRCDCGLEVLLVGDGAQKQITYTAIDEQPQVLAPFEALANNPGLITVVATRP